MTGATTVTEATTARQSHNDTSSLDHHDNNNNKGDTASAGDDGWHDIHVFYGNTSHLDYRGGARHEQDEMVLDLLHQ